MAQPLDSLATNGSTWNNEKNKDSIIAKKLGEHGESVSRKQFNGQMHRLMMDLNTNLGHTNAAGMGKN